MGMRTSNGMDNTRKGVGFKTESRSWTASDQEALVIRTIKNCKWELPHGAKERQGDKKPKYTDGKLMDPRVKSKGQGDNHLKERPLAEDCSTKQSRALGGSSSTLTGILTRGGRLPKVCPTQPGQPTERRSWSTASRLMEPSVS